MGSPQARWRVLSVRVSFACASACLTLIGSCSSGSSSTRHSSVQRVPKQSAVSHAPASRSVPPVSTSTSEPAASSSAALPAVGTVREVTIEELGVTWRPGCPVSVEDLRAVTVRVHDDAGTTKTAELIVHVAVAADIAAIFEDIYAAGYPVHEVATAATRGGDDDLLMAEDVTSAFNCRYVDGTTKWSNHASGRAIDINPFENPWVRSGARIDPPAAAQFADRTLNEPKLILSDGPLVQAFKARGWTWGGDWADPDYQHFERANP